MRGGVGRGDVRPDLERTLNMGVGFVAMLPAEQVDTAARELEARGIPAWVIGEVTGAEDAPIKTVKMDDATAGLLPVRLAEVRNRGDRKVVPHNAVIYNPDGDVFVYTKPKAETYRRAPIEIVRVKGDDATLSKGPAAGTKIVTTGSAELLATEYEILNQHP